MAHGADSLKSILFALAANFAIFLAKLAAALFTGSGAMLAEAVHSLADTGNQGLLLLGIRQAKRPPSFDYPLGHGKEIYFWSFIVALILFSMGGLFSIYEGYHKLHDPEPLKAPFVALAVLLFSLAAESMSLWGCVREVNKERGGRSFVRWFRETRNSALLVVFGEDIAALLGLAFAAAAVLLTIVTGNPFYDALGSIVIGVLLVTVALFIGLETKSLLVGQGVDPATKQAMADLLSGRPEVERVLNLLTLQLGEDVMVAVKARMRPAGSEQQLIANINACEQALKAAFPQVQFLFFEPDLFD
ncbi:cation diffusion facilitator family transporter [Desulfobulbus sp.]|uniref:cation diffusion facilitator family transporter n=1 Tax=Desulfobulbus sp. TaxID=895 RepID=UPI0027BA8FE6|nr:cation diffusion facilitator family transporter [Desulfobulbus sp.]